MVIVQMIYLIQVLAT